MPNTPAVRWVLATAFVLSSAEALAQTAPFVARRDFPGGPIPRSLVEGDFNSDGASDLAVGNATNNTVSILLSNGDGTFPAPRSVAVGDFPYYMATGDFNGDAMLDLAAVNVNSNDVSVLLGNGDGTFQDARSFSAGINPGFLAVSDFNADGHPDLAVTDGGNSHCGDLPGPCTYDSGSVLVLLGRGDGTFEAARSFEQGTVPSFLAVGDFNGDWLPDLAVIDFLSPTTVSVLLGNGDGTFQPAQRFDVGSRPHCVAAADVNRDGRVDLVVGTNNVSVLLGNGDGTFQTSLDIAEDSTPISVDVRDVNGDGVPDLTAILSGRTYLPDAVSLLWGNGDGTFQLPRSFGTNGGGFLAVGDFNRDGVPDAAVAGSSQYVAVLIGLGDGTFQTAPYFGVGTTPVSVALSDLNGDAKADVVTANYSSNTISVLLCCGDGAFQPAQSFAVGMGPLSLAVGDFNGDGMPDVVTANVNAGNVSVLLGNGDGTFRTAQNVAVGGSPSSVAVGDFNGDGVLDLAVATMEGFSNPGYVLVLAGNGDGTFQAPRTVDGGNGSRAVAVGDVNGDGTLDLAVANAGTYPYYIATVSVLLGNGDGTFRNTHYAAGQFPRSVALGDFNGDMALDLVEANADPDGVSVLLNNGDGTFQAAVPVAAGGSSSAFVAVGDFNRDVKLDLVVAKRNDNHVLVLLGNGDGTFQAELAFGTRRGPSAVALGDFDSDGNTDLAVADADSNDLSVLSATQPVTYWLSVINGGNGSGTVTSSSPQSSIDCGNVCTAAYPGGAQVTLTADAAFGSTFAGWSGCDAVSGATCTVTMNAARAVVAAFVLLRFDLTVRKDGIGAGTVTSDSNPASATQINCGTTCSASYDWDTVVTLTATPAVGSLFMGWSGCDTVSGSACTVIMRADTAVKATFMGVPLPGLRPGVPPRF